MKSFVLLGSLLALATPLPVTAQAGGTYLCTPDDSNDAMRYRIGPRLLQSSYKGPWSSNWCSASGASCWYEGSRFIGRASEFDFEFNKSTGRYWVDAEMGGDLGACRPE